jgi:very-short-patch-repair endonuclease/type I restriction-modification system DNA methylase subunit
MSLFQHTILKKQIVAHSEKIGEAYKLFSAYFLNSSIQKNIRNSKEEQFQEGFLRELFVKILGYTLNPEPNYNLITEKKNETDSKKADGAILINGEVKAVIELKDHKTTDLKQVETQAFGYKNNNRKTSYVIISNFEKLRFYIENTIDFEEFNLFALSEDDFAVLWICLAYENIATDLPKQLKNESTNSEDRITKKFYKDYSSFKQTLFDDIQTNNPSFDKPDLFRKTQKLLDRFLFILFAEDKGLLPPNSMKRIIEQWDARNDDPLNEYQPLYNRFKLYFKYMNEGHKGKTEDIFGYNGGLFKPDEILNVITIDDGVLKENILKLIAYDFDTEVDVNILGHIFEHSLVDFPHPLPLSILERGVRQDGVRKRDGVFYTPRYITSYIVENTLGKLCDDKKAELNITSGFIPLLSKKEKKQFLETLTTYREWLLSLTICDPACGSGAFLNAALDFLMSEHRLIDEWTAKLFGGGIVFPNIENAILENNLYGVDINEESVEIARLALWLRTAKPQRKLNSLNNNIKCGNSLISPHPQPLSILERGAGATEEVRTVEIQIPPQLLANARELRKNQTDAEYFLWQLLRGRKLNNLKFRRQHPLNAGFILDFYCAEAKLGIELDGGYHNEKNQQAYDIQRTEIIKEYGINIIRFKNENVLLDTEDVLKKIVAATLPSPFWRGVGGEEKAFDWHKEFPQVFEKGGFDVVIGNPPYGAKIDKQQIAYLSEKYAHWGISSSLNDTYFSFYAMALENILASNGYLGFITPNTWKLIEGAKRFRKVLFDNFEISQIIQHLNKVFEDATVDCDTLIIRKSPSPLTRDCNPLLLRFMNKSTIEKEHSLPQSFLAKQDYINLFLTQKDYDLKAKIAAQSVFVKDELTVKNGVKPYEKGKGKPAQTAQTLKEKPFTSEIKKDETFSPLIGGSSFHRYKLLWNNDYWIQYGEWLAAPREKEIFEAEEKLIFRQTGDSIIGAYITKGFIMRDNTHVILNKENSAYNLKYVLALLNSKLVNWYYWTINPEKGEAMAQVKAFHLGLLPLPSPANKGLQPLVISLADKMLSLNADLQTKRQRFLKRLSDNFNTLKITGTLESFEKLEFKQLLYELQKQKITLSLKQQDEWEEYFNDYKAECVNFASQIDATDKEINRMVYMLYGLTEEEIGIIENQ